MNSEGIYGYREIHVLAQIQTVEDVANTLRRGELKYGAYIRPTAKAGSGSLLVGTLLAVGSLSESAVTNMYGAQVSHFPGAGASVANTYGLFFDNWNCGKGGKYATSFWVVKLLRVHGECLGAKSR